MQLIILAAGKGTRMRPLTYEVAKPMAPIKGRPKLEYALESLPDDISEVIFVINYLGEQIKDHFGDEFCGVPIKYVKQKELNGTGGAVHACKDLVEDRFLVMMGDDFYLPSDIERMAKEELAVLVFKEKEPSTAAAILTDENNSLTEIVEKDDPRYPKEKEKLVNAALYALTPSFFKYPLVKIRNGEYGLPQTLITMKNDFDIKVVSTEKWLPMSSVEDVAEAERQIGNFYQ